ncbi:dihydrodipicolinate synthase family protein [Dietzia psychralcaliphila]|uniref:dihydrodipicolinate synthase family protein n=1 Tax=Dietzia psychralcaliphila TaxID=139021 RepID=UPI001C1E8054|nr:dihydrodipicolinate synthase family protein [Dietzia psychralcaliphila]
MFTGLSAFPVTPLSDAGVDSGGLSRIVERLVGAGVESIGALGSTGSYPYLSTAERAQAARAAVSAAGDVPVIIGVGALTLSDVIRNVDAAQAAGASGLLVSVMTYQPLTDEEVVAFFEDVAARSSVPICVYDNPGTTHVTFTDSMHERIAALPQVRSIKLPGAPVSAFTDRLGALRKAVPEDVTLGVSGDAFAGDALLGGADVWYSVIGGTLPEPAVALTRAAQRGDRAVVDAIAGQLAPLWELFGRYGSYRVVAHLAVLLGLTDTVAVRRPVRPLAAAAVAELRALLPGLTATVAVDRRTHAP